MENIDIDRAVLEYIDIDIDIDKGILENIDIDKGISENIDSDKISNRLEFGISNRAINGPSPSLLGISLRRLGGVTPMKNLPHSRS